MVTNFLKKSIHEMEREEFVKKSLEKIVSEQKLPKLAELALECSPAFASEKIQQRFRYAVEVLEKEQDLNALWQATLWERSEREKEFGTPWELPVRVAYGVVKDIEEGRDVFNPSEEDIRNSELFEVTVKAYVPDGTSPHCFNEELQNQWIESLIERHRDDLAANREPETLSLMSEEEMVQKMHPVARKLYLRAIVGVSSKEDYQDVYETLSEILKVYKTKEDYEKDTWRERWEKVP